MLTIALLLIFLAGVTLVIGIRFDLFFKRPTLKMYDLGGLAEARIKKPTPQKPTPWNLIRGIAVINKPLVTPEMRQLMFRNSALGLSPEEVLLIKEIAIVVSLFVMPLLFGKELFMLSMFMAVAGGWVLPDFWLRAKIQKLKDQIVKLLPDTVDLLGLCVNAGLDFMMALKWVIEKSGPSILIAELNNVLQEINVGKPRRDALRDLARKWDLPDLSTFSRTLIQADKMGTSVSEALNILSEDMRLARYRRGEAMALKAPLKMLVPLLFCIFPVVGILVGAPIFLDFMFNNPLKRMGGG